jgi:hypothetical protein
MATIRQHNFFRQVRSLELPSIYVGPTESLGTHVTWGLNLGGNNITTVFLQTQSILRAFASSAVKNAGITLDFLEIGNEADLYNNNGRPVIFDIMLVLKNLIGLRNSSYSVTNYVDESVMLLFLLLLCLLLRLAGLSLPTTCQQPRSCLLCPRGFKAALLPHLPTPPPQVASPLSPHSMWDY